MPLPYLCGAHCCFYLRKTLSLITESFNKGTVWVFQQTWGEKEKRVGAGGGGRMDESYRKILHATVRCAVVTRSRSATMRSFVPKIGTKRHTYPHRHTHIKPPTMHTHRPRSLMGQWSRWLYIRRWDEQRDKWLKKKWEMLLPCVAAQLIQRMAVFLQTFADCFFFSLGLGTKS